MQAPRKLIIGDVQGCFQSLQDLLAKVEYREGIDEVYLLGDIINRGPESLASLRWAANTAKVTSVLGNHDFHLLAVASGNHRYHKPSDTLTDILTAPDRNYLFDWLRHRPLLIHFAQHRTTLVHAGIPPQWSLDKAMKMAQKVEHRLQSEDWQHFVHHDLYGNQPTQFSKDLNKIEQMRYTINSFARMRLCTSDGTLEFKHKTSPDLAPKGYAPWFQHPRIDDSCGKILFGHWSTLGNTQHPQALCLDTGCLWGRSLSCYCLESQTITHIDCPRYATLGSIE